VIRLVCAVLLTLIPLVSWADPLVKGNNMVYQGAFRIPVGDFGSPLYTGFSYGGGAIAFNDSSLFMTGNIQKQLVAEISTPTPKIPNSPTDLSNLNYATVMQNFSDITEGNRTKIGIDGTAVTGGEAYIGGLLKYGSKLIGTVYTYYPGTHAYLSHFTSGTALATTGDYAGMYAVGESPSTPTASFVSGWMTKVPGDLQSALGGPALTGNGSLSILSRTSYGPAAFAFDPDRLGIDTPVAATPLIYYDQSHQTFGTTSTSGVWNDTTKMAGIAMVEGSRSVLFFGYHGTGPREYGQWATDPIFADTCRAPDECITGPKGWPICADMNNCTTGRKGIPYDNDPRCAASGSDGCYYDPTGMGAKGPHAYPYVYQVWAYDADELALVKNGTKQPWEVQPYAQWNLPFEVVPTNLFGGAAAYDAATGRLFIVQPQGDTIGTNKMPLVHVFQMDMAASIAASYQIKARVMLLKGSLTLQNNAGGSLVVSAANRSTTQIVTLPSTVAPSGTYSVTVADQPANQTCTVLNGSGTVDANTDITNIVVTCEGSGETTAADTTAPATTASPVGGTYILAQSVTLSANEPATIYYTMDGSTPTTSSSVYSAPLVIAASTTIKYFARDTAGNSEAVKTTTYFIGLGPTVGATVGAAARFSAGMR